MSFVGQELDVCPSVCSYRLCEKAKSALNTPPVFSMYIVGLMSKYLLEQGGLATWRQKCFDKARLLYDAIDSSDGFYHCPVSPQARSRMNVRFLVVGPSDKASASSSLASASSSSSFSTDNHSEKGSQNGFTKKDSSSPPPPGDVVKENEDLKKKFLKEAESHGLFHLVRHLQTERERKRERNGYFFSDERV